MMLVLQKKNEIQPKNIGFARLTLLLPILFLLFFGCSKSSENSEKEYTKATQELENNGVKFSSKETDDGVVVTLNVDEYSKKLSKLDANSDKIKHTDKTIKAVNSLITQTDNYLKNKKLTANEYTEVIAKRRLLNRILPELRNRQDMLGLVELEESLDTLEQKENPYFISMFDDEKLHLCGSYNKIENFVDFDGRTFKAFDMLDKIKVLRVLLCTDQKTIDKTNSIFSDYSEKNIFINKPAYFSAPVSSDNHYIEVPKDRNILKEHSLDIEFERGQRVNYNTELEGDNYTAVETENIFVRQDESELQSKSFVTINLPVLNFLYLLENSNESNESVSFISDDYFFYLNSAQVSNEHRSKINVFFSTYYSKKDEIIKNFNNSHIIQRLDALFEQSIVRSTDQIITMILNKDYEGLRSFATAKNCNQVSLNKNSYLLNEIKYFGMSPLMAAAILDDQTAIDILLTEIEGVDPNLESPVFEMDYKSIGRVKTVYLSSVQRYSGYSGGTGSSSGGSSSDYDSQKYPGYTALMHAVRENNCDAASVIIETKPKTLNNLNHEGKSALSLSLSYSRKPCIKTLLEAGAYDLDIISTTDGYHSEIKRSNVASVEFIKHIDKKEFKKAKVKKALRHAMVFEAIDIDFKQEIYKRLPITKKQVLKNIANRNLSKSKCLESYLAWEELSVCFDPFFAYFIEADLSKEKIFGDEKETLFDYVFSNLKNTENYGQDKIGSFIRALASVSPSWVTDWANPTDSFKGQNILVAASMFGRHDILQTLLSVDGIQADVIDAKTEYNALEWQYVSNSNFLGFATKNPASLLRLMGVKVRDPLFTIDKISLSTGLSAEAKNNMKRILEETSEDPFSGN